MNIGIFTNAYKPIISGVVNSIALIKSGLEARGHQVYIFAPRYNGFKDAEKDIHRFISVNLTSRVKFPLAIPFSFKIFNMIPQLNLDIIHTHHPFILGEVGARFAKKLNIPLVYTFHTQFEQYAHYIPLNQELVKKVARESVTSYTTKCDTVICPSTSILSLLDEYGITAPVQFIPNAINIESFQNPDPKPVFEKYNINPDDKLLVYVGRIGLEKNLEFMLKAFKEAHNRIPSSKLMIVGEGPELGTFREMANDMGMGDCTIFPGRVEYNDIPAYYRAGYAFIMTSTTEVKPLALLEAMAAGLPVVAVSAAGSKDTLTDDFDGILTDHDIEKFTGALIKILEDRKTRDRLSEGASETSRKYSMQNIAGRLEELFVRLINEHQLMGKNLAAGSGKV